MASRFSFFCFLVASSLVASSLTAIVAAQESAESQKFVLSLDHSNFSDTVSKHDFIVVEFFAPWCGHCKTLEPEYETAASVLSSHDPPIVLAKVDASDEANKEIAKEFQIQGFPTIKILRNGGKSVQDYNGPRDSHRIVQYLKRQSGPASVELKSTVDATNLIGEKKIVIVGIFPQFSGEEFTNYTVLTEKLRSDYDLGHTLDAKLLPRGETSVTGPLVRLFKSFDELFVDFEDFDVDAMMKFIDESSVPLVTIFDNEPSNEIFVTKFFDREIERVMLFYNFSSEDAQSFESNYRHIAEQYKGKDIGFLIGDLNTSEEALKYFGIKDDQVPAIFIKSTAQQNYLKRNVDPNQIAAWFKEYKAGNVLPYKKSEPIPEQNDEPVKVVVHDSIQDMVFNSRKNVLLEFYAPWCQHCKTLAPILEEVALSYEADPNVIIAKLDATANDFPTATFDVKGFPTMYFVSATGKLSGYNGARTKESIVEFIEKNRDVVFEKDSNTKDEQIESDVKDEL